MNYLDSFLTANSEIRSNPSKRSQNRKKLPLPSQNGTGSLLGEFLLEPVSQENRSVKSHSSVRSKGTKKSSSLLDENGQNDLLERLSSLSGKSGGSKNSSRRNLPRPSDIRNEKNGGDLLSMFSNQGNY